MRLVSRFVSSGVARLILSAALVLIALASFAQAKRSDSPPQGNVEKGRLLYWRGITSAGSPLQAVTGAGITLSGAQVSCVNCHRPSGFGASEGGTYVPPITGPILFSPRELNRNRIFYKLFKEVQPGTFSSRLREPRMRPAYTGATLAAALKEGVDPANQKFDSEMLRYDLSSSDAANLIAFLRTLSVTPDPGVDANSIHFATIVSDDTDLAQRDAVLNTVSTFFGWMNTNIDGQRARPNFSPNYHSDFQASFRRWQLHVWELHGPPETWNRQLQAYYRRAPVFAVVSGLVDGPWTPIGEFCDAQRLPCIFPNTELPKTKDAPGGYSLYFSRGLELEAEVLAQYLAGRIPSDGSILQLYSDDAAGRVPAFKFVREEKLTAPSVRVKQIHVSSGQAFENEMRRIAVMRKPPDALVLWPGQYLQTALAALSHSPSAMKIISLPADGLEPAPPAVLNSLPASVRFTYPYELPGVYHPRVFLVRQWMNSRKLKIRYPRLQFQTYYALTLVQSALDQILDDYFRDYFVEAIEREAESHLDNGTHPTLALGPGQRFASKGAYIVKIDHGAKGGLRAVSVWIVP